METLTSETAPSDQLVTVGDSCDCVSIKTGYEPGLLGRIITLHACYYSAFHGLGREFETRVGIEMAEFVARFRYDKDAFISLWHKEECIGTVTVHSPTNADNNGYIRWFVLNSRYHGRGLGYRLFQEAMNFCELAGYDTVYLWTFKGLDAAQALYISAGFRPTDEKYDDRWGKPLLAQKYEVTLVR